MLTSELNLLNKKEMTPMAFLHLRVEEMQKVNLVTEVRIEPVTGLCTWDKTRRLWVGNAYSDLFGENSFHKTSPMFSIHSAVVRLQLELEDRMRHGRKV